MMKHSPRTAIAKLDRREEDRVEIYVIFTHELEQTDGLVVKPPLLPLRCVVGRDTRVSDGCIKLGQLAYCS